MGEDALDILLVEDNPGDARLIEEMLGDAETLLERVELDTPAVESLRLHTERTLSAGVDRLDGTDADVVLLDLDLPDSNGLETLSTMADAAESVAVIVLTGLRDERVGIRAIQHGAQDYLVKDEVTSDLLVRSIHHAIERNRQEHRRQRRREQLEALNTLTRDLMEATTPTAVSDHVVDAAEAWFDLPMLAIALYDDAEGGLRLVGATGDATEHVDFDALLSVGDGDGWRAFAEDEPPHVIEDAPTSPPLTELALFPLGSHGLLVTGSTETEGISAADFDFVGTVAGNVETALDRVEREQERQERERLLEEQNRTLERLNEVNDIIRSIGRALVQASTREEVESVVCEQLAEGGPYELAWIGEHEHGSETVVPRECAGSDAEGGAEALSTPDSPAQRAITTREPQVVNNVLENRATEGWRRAALDRGYHAAASLPLVYEEAMYGSLNVYAAQADVFGELERTVLSELADTIAYAINGAESRKALLGQEVTALEFTVTETETGFVELAREHDCTLVAENFVPRSDGGVRRFMTTRGIAPEDVFDAAPRFPVEDLTLVSEYEENGETVCLFRMDLTGDSIEETVLEHGGRPRELRVANGEATVVVELAADAAVREFVELFRNRFPGAELVAQRSQQRPRQSPAEQRASLTEALTDRQLEALQTAYYSGFFDRPRRHTGSEVAASMGISQPTFSHHLREAHRRLCESLFGHDARFGPSPGTED